MDAQISINTPVNFSTSVRKVHTDNINWKALYKVLESEVETIVLDPNCPQYVKDWGYKMKWRVIPNQFGTYGGKTTSHCLQQDKWHTIR